MGRRSPDQWRSEKLHARPFADDARGNRKHAPSIGVLTPFYSIRAATELPPPPFPKQLPSLHQRLHLSRTREPVVNRAAVIKRPLVEKEDSVGEMWSFDFD